ncbi:unnamed protein product [Owenia fusiformis]|uniref:Uncharacterized protein n=1 Tax=Owenia fusiformis TaxID=6347 RepID=A0A8J1TY86_OWEFU|nr:unnamed protein product [Owenia fusiformis]
MKRGESTEDLIFNGQTHSPEDIIGETLFPMTHDGSMGANTIAADAIATALPTKPQNNASNTRKVTKRQTSKTENKLENEKRSGHGKDKNGYGLRKKDYESGEKKGCSYPRPIVTHQLSVDDSWIKVELPESGSNITPYTKIPREYKLKIFVMVLSVVIIVSTILIWYFHPNTNGNIRLGDHLKLGRRSRRLILDNIEGEIVLYADLGTRLPQTNPVGCAPLEEERDENLNELCLGFLEIGQLNVSRSNHGYKDKTIECYDINWSLVYDYDLTDCFKFGNAHWYGGGTINGYPYPLENKTVDGASFLTGRIQDGDEFGSVLNPSWFNSNGVSIQMDQSLPLYISISHDSKNAADSGEMCISSKCDNVSYASNCETSSMRYTICSAGDNSPRTIQGFLKNHQSSNSSASEINTKYITHPVWSTAAVYGGNLTSGDLNSFINEIAKHSEETEDELGTVIIEEGWQGVEGDLEFDNARFENIRQILAHAENLGFEINIAVTPFIAVESEIFHETVRQNLLVSDASGVVPGLTALDSNIVAVLDFTYNTTQEWFIDRLKTLARSYGIDSYVFKYGQVRSLPYQPHFHSRETSPSQFSNSLSHIASSINSKVVTSSYYGQQSIPIFMQMSPMMSSWNRTNGIKGVIPAILAHSAIGKTFVIPPSVGGFTDNSCSDSELFIRWFQLSIFLPVLHLSVPPWYCIHNNKLVLEIASELLLIRKNIVIPKLLQTIKYIESNLTDGSELINPIWWIAPNDDVALTVSDQFLIGSDLLVAPVLEQGATSKQVYLPVGTWQDIKGDKHEGGSWVHYDVSLTDVLYFIKQPSVD